MPVVFLPYGERPEVVLFTFKIIQERRHLNA